MRFEELSRRVAQTLAAPEYAVSWYRAGEYSDAGYAIVPLPDGRFTLYRPSGRGAYYDYLDEHGNARIFPDEDAVCDFVWAKLTEPAPAPIRGTVRTPEERAERLADQRRRAYASLGIADPALPDDH